MPTANRLAGLFAASAASALITAVATGAQAQDATQVAVQTNADPSSSPATPAASVNEVIVTGTRSTAQTRFTALSPVDVFSEKAVNSTITSNLGETLQQLVPAFTVQRLPASDGPEFVQPAELDGLSPDMTLVMLNGKRFHNSAFIQGSSGTGAASGSQSPDLSQIPTFAIDRIEVLRDGASAQYGSDAIAGVINIILNTKPGLDLYTQGSQYYAGDGTAGEFGARAATALPGGGHLMVTAEYATTGFTSRTVQRPDAIAFQQAHPDIDLPDPVQRWGNPATTTWKYAFDAAEPLGNVAEAYVFGTLGEGQEIADINWRNPSTNASVFNTTAAFPGFNLNTVFPGGFTPHEGERYNDTQVDIGIRHKTSDTFTWDLSASYGQNNTGLILNNSINASLGPASPLNFNLGHYIESDFDLNADFNYRLNLGFLPRPVDIAFGAERRVETFEARSGDPASYAVGPGAAFGLAPESNGFPGISPQQAGTFGETSYAGYFDVTAPVTTKWDVEFAARDESYQLFGNTFNYKFASRYELTSDLAVRASYSTGFKAPTPGQLNSTSTSQSLDNTTLTLITSGRISPLNPVAQFFGATPLKPETSDAVTGGFIWKTHFGFSGSVDIYQIKVDNRFSQSPNFNLTPADVAQLVASGVPGAASFTQVSFYTNAFSTATRGIDVVGDYKRRLGPGQLDLNGSYSYTNTQVTGGNLTTQANFDSKIIFEQGIPQHNAVGTATYSLGPISLMGRMRYYGAWTDASGTATGDAFQRFGGIVYFDLGATYAVTKALSVRVGAENVGDTYPDKSTNQNNRGLLYSRDAPYDTNGGNYYVRLEAHF